MPLLFDIYPGQTATIGLFMTAVNIIIHIIFAGGVARDAGRLTDVKQKPILVSGITWAFATLLGGVFVAALYWLIHHSKLTRTGYNLDDIGE